jgi:TPR repeat protein
MSKYQDYKQLAKQGDANAQYNVALCLASGREGANIDTPEAINYFKESANGGIADAAYALGIAYGIGNGVEQNFRSAHYWFLKAVELGKPEANQDVLKAEQLMNETC